MSKKLYKISISGQLVRSHSIKECEYACGVEGSGVYGVERRCECVRGGASVCGGGGYVPI